MFQKIPIVAQSILNNAEDRPNENHSADSVQPVEVLLPGHITLGRCRGGGFTHPSSKGDYGDDEGGKGDGLQNQTSKEQCIVQYS